MAQKYLQTMPYVRLQEFDNYSKELGAGTLEFFAASTDVHLATYKDALGQVENTNPILLDLSGSADVFFQLGKLYDIKCCDLDGNQLWYKRNIGTAGGGNEGSFAIVDNYDALRNLDDDYDLVFVRSNTVIGDGGEGWFQHATADSTSGDDSGICLVRGSSRYKRLVESSIDPRWYGVKYSYTASQNVALEAAFTGAETWGLTVALAGKAYLTEDLHITSGLRILKNGGYYGNGTVYFDTGSQLLECAQRAFTSASGTTPVFFASGTTAIVNPNWFDASDDNKLAFANASTASSNLWPDTGLGVAGWEPVTKQHTPGNILPLTGTLTAPIDDQSVDISFELTRPDTVNLGSGAWSLGQGWSIDTTDVASYVLQRLTSGGTGLATMPTKCKAGLTYHVELQIVNQANPDQSGNVGTFSVDFNGTTIAASTGAGTTNYSSDLTIVSPNPTLTITPSQYAYGYVTNAKITCSRTIHDNELADAIYTNDSSWTGSWATGFSHVQGAATPLSASVELTAGHKYRGQFSIARLTHPTTNLLLAVTPTVDANYAGSTSAGYHLSSWAVGTYDIKWVVPTTPGTAYNLSPSFSDTVSNDIQNVNGGHSYQYANHDAVGIWAGGTSLCSNSDATGYHPDEDKTFIATSATTEIVMRIICATNSVESVETSRLRYGYLGNVALNLTATDNVGSLTVSVGGTPVVVNEHNNVIQKSGTYTFEVTTTATTETFVITPTSDFFGSITASSLQLLDKSLGDVGVYVGTELVGTASETRTYTMVGSNLTGTQVLFQPSLLFDGMLSNILVSKHASNATVKLTDTYTVTGDVTITAPCDPWQGKIIASAATGFDIRNLTNVNASQWISFGALDYVKASNFGSTQAQPEWAGGVGDGASDDTIALKFALYSSACYLSGQYRMMADFTVGNIDATGPLGSTGASTTSPGIKLDQSIVLTCTGLTAQGIAIVHGRSSKIVDSGSASLSYAYYVDEDSTSIGDSLTCTSLFAQDSTINTVHGINNSQAATINRVTLSSVNTSYKSIPVALISSADSSTWNNCKPFTTVDGAVLKSCKFNSPNDWQFLVPVNATVDAKDCYSSGNLAYCVDSTSILNVHNISGINDTAADSDITVDLNCRILSNGVGTVNEWTTETNKPTRNTINGLKLNTIAPMPGYTTFNWTSDIKIWSAFFQNVANLESPQGAWYRDGSGHYHYWNPGDVQSKTSEGVVFNGSSITIHSPGETSWNLTTKASDDVPTRVQEDFVWAWPSSLPKPVLSFVSNFGHIIEMTITVPAGMHVADDLISTIKLDQMIRMSYPNTSSVRFDGLDTNAFDEICYRKQVIIPKSSTEQTIKISLPVMFEHGVEVQPNPDGLNHFASAYYHAGIPKFELFGQNCDGVTISLISRLELPLDNRSLAMMTRMPINTSNNHIQNAPINSIDSGMGTFYMNITKPRYGWDGFWSQRGRSQEHVNLTKFLNYAYSYFGATGSVAEYFIHVDLIRRPSISNRIGGEGRRTYASDYKIQGSPTASPWTLMHSINYVTDEYGEFWYATEAQTPGSDL